MMKSLIAVFLAAGLSFALPLASANAQTPAKTGATDTPAKSTKAKKAADGATAEKPAKKLTAQQQKMKDCGAKWQDEKKSKSVSGAAAYRKFLSTCLKG